MLHYALTLDMVTLAEDQPAWPAPLSLAVSLSEVVLIEGVGPVAGEALLEVAATLASPAAGRVGHWGQNAAALPREELYLLRRRIAYISPRPVLLHRLSLGENIALASCYHLGYSESAALAAHPGLLEHLDLRPYLDRYPAQVSAAVYARAVWARELVKEPELILAMIPAGLAATGEGAMPAPLLRAYLATHGAAAVLLGESLEAFHPLGHRLFRLEAGQLRQQPLLERRPRPLTAYLPLV
jgi:cell division transport system ATP-binding protein